MMRNRITGRVVALSLLVQFLLPSAAYADWQPDTTIGRNPWLEHSVEVYAKKIETYNEFAMWQQEMRLPKSARVANTFAEFQGKLAAGYRGVTVNQAAAISGKSPEAVVRVAQRSKDLLKRSPGARTVAAGSKGGMVAGTLGAAALSLAGEWAIDKLVGTPVELHADGSVCGYPPLMCPDYWTEPHYTYVPKSLVGDEVVPDELAYLFPGFEMPMADPVPVYQFVAGEGVVRPTQPTDPQRGWATVLGATLVNWSGAEWTEDSAWLASRMLEASTRDMPLMPSVGYSVAPHVSAFYSGGFVNMVTGESYSKLKTGLNGFWLFQPGEQGYDQFTLRNHSSAASWAAARQWYESEMNELLAAGLVTEVMEQGEVQQVDTVPVPTPPLSSLPSVGVFNGQDADAPLTYDDPLADWVDLYESPTTLPSPVELETGVTSADQRYQVVLAPAIDEITLEARRRWPYAAIGILFDPDVGPGEDPAPLDLAFPLPVPGGGASPGPVRVEIAEALEPIKPWRPFGVAMVSVGVFAAMWAILKPELHV